ncbi:nitrate ABC transporter [Klebsiella pneumoniae subsp. pneumoniae]|nr:nitrate ABC transporter [Klebsiella pneumoniae subsp. pneumoniae]
MKQAQRKQPVVSVDNAPGEVIILPPVQVRRTTPAVTRWLRELTQRLLPPLLGLGVLLLAWQLAAMHSKGFPTPLSTLDSALTLFADPFYQDGPNDMGIGWNVLASLQRVAVGFGLAALAGIPLGFLIGRSLFFARMFNPLIALLRPVSPLAWLPIGLLLFQKAEPASSWTIFICSIWPMVINTAGGCAADPAGLSQRRPRPPALGVDGDAQNPLSGGAAGGAYRRAPLHRHRLAGDRGGGNAYRAGWGSASGSGTSGTTSMWRTSSSPSSLSASSACCWSRA